MNRTYLLDLETQVDFFARGGLMGHQIARDVTRNITSLFIWASNNDIPIISTIVEFQNKWDCPYPTKMCMENTTGVKKLPQTITKQHIKYGPRNITDFSEDIFDQYRQVIFEKRDTDIFNHQRIERMITDFQSGRFIVCGVGIAYSIVQAVVGLRSRGFPVVVASDAILPVAVQAEQELSIMRMLAKGAVFSKTVNIVNPAPAKVHNHQWKTDKDKIKPGRK